MKKLICKICGKVGSADEPNSLIRHVRLAHHVRKVRLKEWFLKLDDDEDSPLDILPCPQKEYSKRKNVEANAKWKKMRNKELDQKYGKLQHKSISWCGVLVSAFETKR